VTAWPVLGVLCEAAARDPYIAEAGHTACHGNAEVRLPNDPPTAQPIITYRCDCECHKRQEALRNPEQGRSAW
jgi:hypothetical protein